MSSTTKSRSCAFSASSRSSSLWLLRSEICLSEAAFAWRVRSRATCRLSTFFTPFDRELSFMISPLLSPTVLQPPEWQESPNISERPTSNLSGSSRRDCPFFPPSWISSEVRSDCHTRHADDAGFCPLSAARRTDVLAFPLLTKVDLACGGLL